MAPKRRGLFLPRLPAGWDRPLVPSPHLGARPLAAASASSPTTRGLQTSGHCSTGPTPSTTTSGADTAAPAGSTAGGPARLAKRKDAPLALPPSRSSRTDALAAARDEESRRQAMETYASRTFAASGQGTRDSTWKTWSDFHRAWHGPVVPALPLTPDILAHVTAMFISGRYRAAQNYISHAKDEHIRQGHPWTDALAREHKRAVAAAGRGMGPGHQCAELPLHRVLALQIPVMPDDTKLPINFRCMVIVGCMFLLREIEASLLLDCNVELSPVDESITLFLSASKTDPKALTVHRTWRCTCSAGRLRACPYHEAVAHRKILLAHFGANGALPAEMPFFPSAAGDTLDKDKVVAAIESVAAQLELPLRSSDGRNAFGGHAFRVAGALHLASLGMDSRLIALHARWQSAVVLRYIAEAPLARLTDQYKALQDGFRADFRHHDSRTASSSTSSSSSSARTSDAAAAAAMTACKSEATAAMTLATEALAKVDDLTKELEVARTELALLEADQVMPYVVGTGPRATGVVHRIVGDYRVQPASQWSTGCGWRYGASNFQRLLRRPFPCPEGLLCSARCFPRSDAS